MSLEEDYLMVKTRELEERVNALEAMVTYPKSKKTAAAGEQPELGDAPDTEGGEQSSDGTSSETSTEKPPTSSATSKRSPRKRAQTTARRSSKDPEESSTARSTDTSGPGTDA